MTSDELSAQYVLFGEDPFILGPEAKMLFRARDYARVKAEEICQNIKQ